MKKKNIKCMTVSVIVNFLLSVFKIVFGFLLKSSAIISDGIHSFSDLITDFVAIFGINKSHKKEDDVHPFGHGMFEYITSLIIGLFMLFLAYEMVTGFLNADNTIPSFVSIYIVIPTILAKLLLASYLSRKGKTSKNQILIASGRESFQDVYSSILVLISILISRIDFKYNIYMDKFAAIIIAVIIFKNGIVTIIESARMLLGSNVDDKEMEVFKKEILSNVKEVKKIDKFLLLKFGPYYKAIVDIQVDKNMTVEEGHNIGRKVKKVLLSNENINYVKTHVEPYETDKKEA